MYSRGHDSVYCLPIDMFIGIGTCPRLYVKDMEIDVLATLDKI